MRHRIMVKVLLAMGALWLLQGCNTTGKPWWMEYEVKIRLQDEWVNRSGHYPPIQVHVVGLNYQEAVKWSNFSMSRYWRPHSERPSHVYLVNLGGTRNRDHILPLSDPIWRQWERAGAVHLFVMADLPGIFEDKPGTEDARRLIVPLDRKRWPSRTIEIMLWEDRITHWPSLIPVAQ